MWTARSLRNKTLACRLAVIDPASEGTLEDLRNRLLDVIHEHLDSNEFPMWARVDDQFEFIRFQLVVFNTGIAVEQLSDLVEILPRHRAPGSTCPVGPPNTTAAFIAGFGSRLKYSIPPIYLRTGWSTMTGKHHNPKRRKQNA